MSSSFSRSILPLSLPFCTGGSRDPTQVCIYLATWFVYCNKTPHSLAPFIHPSGGTFQSKERNTLLLLYAFFRTTHWFTIMVVACGNQSRVQRRASGKVNSHILLPNLLYHNSPFPIHSFVHTVRMRVNKNLCSVYMFTPCPPCPHRRRHCQ